MPYTKPLIVGTHISISKGFCRALIDAKNLGCSALQFFVKNNRQWAAKALAPEDALSFRNARSEVGGISSVVIHATYLINLASSNDVVLLKSRNALIDELIRADMLGAEFIVVHPGSHNGSSQESGVATIIESINYILANTDTKTMLLIETMAGQGSVLCYTFEQIAHILQNINNPQKVGVCVDTCHIFAAGYTFSTPETYNTMWDHFDKTIGIQNLKVIHVNDSKKKCGSRIDRHDHIGKGAIGIDAFKMLCNDSRFTHIPKILETPKDSPLSDLMNIQTLEMLLDK